MALTRKALKAMGLTEEQVDSVVEMHTETVDGLKADIGKYKADAEKLPGVQKELEDLEAKQTRAAKEKAVMEHLKSKGVQEANLKLAMRSLSAEIDAAELDGEKLKDVSAFDSLLDGDLKGLVTTTVEKPAPNPANPPKIKNGPAEPKSLAEALKQKYNM